MCACTRHALLTKMSAMVTAFETGCEVPRAGPDLICSAGARNCYCDPAGGRLQLTARTSLCLGASALAASVCACSNGVPAIASTY